MSKLILIRGLPGSGKSTMAKELTKIGFVHYEADMFHIHNGEYLFNPDNAKAAHLWCQQQTFRALDVGLDVVVSNTFTQHWEMQPYIDFNFGYAIIIARGQFKNVHNVPEHVLRAMAHRWED